MVINCNSVSEIINQLIMRSEKSHPLQNGGAAQWLAHVINYQIWVFPLFLHRHMFHEKGLGKEIRMPSPPTPLFGGMGLGKKNIIRRTWVPFSFVGEATKKTKKFNRERRVVLVIGNIKNELWLKEQTQKGLVWRSKRKHEFRFLVGWTSEK